MSKPQIHRLESNEQQYDFILIGIICQHKDYKLCYELNQKLEIDLIKCDDYELFFSARKAHCSFARFEYKGINGDKFILLSNKSARGTLLQEQPQLDYLLMITENQPNENYSTVVKTLKEISVVLGAFSLDPLQLSSREYLIME